MRMWMVDPKLMCDQHLLGEHVELHMFVGTLKKGVNVQGYVDKGLLEVHNILNRHEDLVKEMLSRGMQHKSPLSVFPLELKEAGKIDVKANLIELKRRCAACRKRIEAATNRRPYDEV